MFLRVHTLYMIKRTPCMVPRHIYSMRGVKVKFRIIRDALPRHRARVMRNARICIEKMLLMQTLPICVWSIVITACVYARAQCALSIAHHYMRKWWPHVRQLALLCALLFSPFARTHICPLVYTYVITFRGHSHKHTSHV